MVVRDGRVTDTHQSELAELLRDMLRQQTAMLQVQAESVRLQRNLVERLLGASDQMGTTDATPPVRAPAPSVSAATAPLEASSDLPFAPAPADPNVPRGARYYQPRQSLAARSIAPEDLELMRRLREMRDASDLILQFGPYRGSTLAQVAMGNPGYIRQLMTGARRPEVRAAATRLVQAIDAAAEHKRQATRGSVRRGRPTR